MFREDDFIIIHPQPVYAIIEIKRTIENSKQKLIEIFLKASENGIKIIENKKNHKDPTHFFNGLFSYDSKMECHSILEAYKGHRDKLFENSKNDSEDYLKIIKGHLNHLCINPDIYMNTIYHGFGAFKKEKQAPAYFISKLFEHLKFYELYGSEDWFAFPRGDGEKIDSIITIDPPEKK